jgi:adenylosuccinate synthase
MITVENKNIAVLGAQFGDEGKGRIAHAFAPDFDWVIRFGGGANAGHTIYRDGIKFVHNLLPSVDFRFPRTKAFLGAGMVIDLEQLFNELNIAEKTFPGVSNRIYVDPDAFVVLEKHKEEDKAKNIHLGTTNRGIGPAYADKISRYGVKIRKLINDDSLITGALAKLGVKFKNAFDLRYDFNKQRLLFEGAQGVLLDINHGTYPYVSSSDCTIAGIYSSGFGFAMPQKVYGVAKAYATRVGEGPFPTELDGDAAINLREAGHEYGATTGRPRRVGWLDLPALQYAIDRGGITDLIITKLDILNGFNKVPICMRYDKMPSSSEDFFKSKIRLMEVQGWTNPRDYLQIKDFIFNIEYFTNCKVSYISCGVNKEDILKL